MRSFLSASLLGLVAAQQTGKIDYLPGYANANGYSMFSGYLNVSFQHNWRGKAGAEFVQTTSSCAHYPLNLSRAPSAGQQDIEQEPIPLDRGGYQRSSSR
jgi:hypothetical protein